MARKKAKAKLAREMVSPRTFLRWLSRAKRGEGLVYAAFGQTLFDERANGVIPIAAAARKASEDGKVELSQVRIGPGSYRFVARVR